MYQRLHRVHQRDRTSKALGSAVFWAIYAGLFLVFGFSSAFTGDDMVFGASLLATVFSFAMATRALARYHDGMTEREPQAAQAYIWALSAARQKFVKATPKTQPSRPPVQAAWQRLGKKIRKKLPQFRGVIHLALVGGILTVGLYWWLRSFQAQAFVSTWCLLASCLGVIWLLSTRLHAIGRKGLAWLFRPGLAPTLDWTIRITGLVLLCWPVPKFLASWILEQADAPLWGVALDLAALEVVGGIAIAGNWSRFMPTREVLPK